MTEAKLDETLLAQLRQTATLSELKLEHLPLLAGAQWVRLPKGGRLTIGETGYRFWVLLQGELILSKLEGDQDVHVLSPLAGETFGEVPILTGWSMALASMEAKQDARLLSIPEQGFWELLTACPAIRTAVLANKSRRFEAYQAMALHKEKLISLGTLAAGLMHELNNPGAAARRAAAHLRENIGRLQHISLRMTRTRLSGEQLECLADLQEQVLMLQKPVHLSPLEQGDREEEMSDWLGELQVENAWRLAPTLVSAGWTREDVACAQHSFPPGILSDTLNYLEALIGSVQHVGTIEESIGRVTDLVVAVKKYAYDDKRKQQPIDVRDTLLSALTILSHKFRHKNIHVVRDLPAGETRISCMGAGLAQVWTNLLDNAVDAVAEDGEIAVRLWSEQESVCVTIRDNGPGIAPEHRDHIFEPFYTTKEAGVGTGLGLDIAQRIVRGNFKGEIRFQTGPEGTEFTVSLPMAPMGSQRAGCSVESPER